MQPNTRFSDTGTILNIFFRGDAVEFSGQSNSHDDAMEAIPIPNFTFEVEIKGPGGKTVHHNIYTTDKDGKLHFSIPITNDFEFGRYRVNYTMSKEGYTKRVIYGENTESLIFHIMNEDMIQPAAGFDFKLITNEPILKIN